MRNIFTSRQTPTSTQTRLALVLACALALGVLSVAAGAQVLEDEHAVVIDSSGAPVMSGFGLCLRNGFGPAPSWTTGCHAEVPAPVAQYTVAQYIAPAASPEREDAFASAGTTAEPAPLPVWEKVVLDANVLFDSDRSALRPAGRDTLDHFVLRIHGLDSQEILAIGHADRMGTQAANQTLSQQRVDTVKAYLVGKGIASSRVQTSAMGEMQPTTFLADCKDANNAKNVACMQPDRHVFLEVSGTRIAR